MVVLEKKRTEWKDGNFFSGAKQRKKNTQVEHKTLLIYEYLDPYI